LLQVDAVRLDNVPDGAQFTLKALPALDGKVATSQVGYLSRDAGDARMYLFSAIGRNVSLLFVGGFSLVSLVIDMHPVGRS
jgi:hypothetical protein